MLQRGHSELSSNPIYMAVNSKYFLTTLRRGQTPKAQAGAGLSRGQEAGWWQLPWAPWGCTALKGAWRAAPLRMGICRGEAGERTSVQKESLSLALSRRQQSASFSFSFSFCRTRSSGPFLALSPPPLGDRSLPSSFPALHQAPLDTTGDLWPRGRHRHRHRQRPAAPPAWCELGRTARERVTAALSKLSKLPFAPSGRHRYSACDSLGRLISAPVFCQVSPAEPIQFRRDFATCKVPAHL